MTEQTQLSVATNYEKHIFIYIYICSMSIKQHHKMFITGPFLTTKTEAVHLCPTFCCVMYCTGNTYTNAHKTQQDKTTTVITCRNIYEFCTIQYMRKNDKTSSKQTPFSFMFVKSTPSLIKPMSHKNSKQRNMKNLNPKKDCICTSLHCLLL